MKRELKPIPRVVSLNPVHFKEQIQNYSADYLKDFVVFCSDKTPADWFLLKRWYRHYENDRVD